MMKSADIVLIACVITVSPVLAMADAPPERSNSVQRQSDDRDADLIQALIANQRFDDAQSVCRWQLDRHQKSDDQYALAITRLAETRIAQQIASGDIYPSSVASVSEPINQLLLEYPDHHRRWFLQAALVSVRQTAVEMEVAGAAINLGDQAKTLSTMTRLTRLMRDCESLIVRIRESTPQDRVIEKDHQRLEHELLVASVSMALMQTELFVSDSPDAIAAATAAIEAATQARLKLPDDSRAAQEIQRMQITAILRSGDPKLASVRLQQLTDQLGTMTSPNLRALQIECLLALGQNSEANDRLREYFGDSPNNSDPSISMDLARLHYLMTTENDELAAQWMNDIERRDGMYARRRAEALAISKMDKVPSHPESSTSSMALIETRGRQLIRDGDFAGGGRMLARLAGSQADPKRAFEVAILSAAGLKQANLSREGSTVLTTVARKHSSASKAAALDFQAIVMLASDSPPVSNQELETRLRQHLQTWPESEVAASARDWLIQLLESRDSFADAAVIATSLTPSQINPSAIDTLVSKWRHAFKSSKSDVDDKQLTAMAQSAFASLRGNPLAVAAHRQLAACFFDRSALLRLPDKPSSEADWVEQVLQFRRDGKLDLALRPLTDHVDDLRRRLIRDGRQNPAIRKRNADLLNYWTDSSVPIIDQATVQLWLSNVDDAIAIVDSWIATNNQSDHLIQAATLFQDSNDANSLAAAIRFWDRLAAGSMIGSDQWHRGKLAAIDILYRSGKKADASQRAKYILLTQTDISEQQRIRYQSYQP